MVLRLLPRRLAAIAVAMAVVVALGLPLRTQAAGGTSVCGSVSTSATWNAAGSPYLLCASGVDLTGGILTIDGSGGPVSVLAQGTGGLDVSGNAGLRTTGTGPSSMVTFDGQSPVPGAWAGITIHSPLQFGTSLSYVQVSHAVVGISTTGGHASIDHAVVTDTSSDGVDGSTDVTNSSIARTGGDGIHCECLVSGTTVDHASGYGIWDALASGNGTGPVPPQPPTAGVNDNIITNSGTASPVHPAMYLHMDDALGNAGSIVGNQGGGNGLDLIDVEGRIYGPTTWMSPTNQSALHPLGYASSHIVVGGGTLTFPAGSVVKLGPQWLPDPYSTSSAAGSLLLGWSGSLPQARLDATAGRSLFTSLDDNSAGLPLCPSVMVSVCQPRAGSFGGMEMRGGGTATLVNAEVRNAATAVRITGDSEIGAPWDPAATLDLSTASIHDSSAGLDATFGGAHGGPVIDVTSSSFSAIDGTAVQIHSASAYNIDGSTFTGIGGQAIAVENGGTAGLPVASSVASDHVDGAAQGVAVWGDHVAVRGNDIRHVTSGPALSVRGTFSMGAGNDVDANTGSGNGADVMQLTGTITTPFTWTSPSVNPPGAALGDVISQGITLGPGASLTLPAGAVVKGDGGILLQGANLDATAGGATFTSADDDTVGVPLSGALGVTPESYRFGEAGPANDPLIGPIPKADGTYSGQALVTGAQLRAGWHFGDIAGGLLPPDGAPPWLVLATSTIDGGFANAADNLGMEHPAIDATMGRVQVTCSRMENNSGGVFLQASGSSITNSVIDGNSGTYGGSSTHYYDISSPGASVVSGDWWGQTGGPGAGQVAPGSNAVTQPPAPAPPVCAPPAATWGSITIQPSSLTFSGAVGTPTPSQTLTVRNGDPGVVTMSSAALTGRDASEFQVTHDGCAGVRLLQGQSCAITVAMDAMVSGSDLEATVNVLFSGAAGSPRVIRLFGSARGSP